MKSPQEEPANYSRTRLLRFLVPDDAAGLRLDQVLAGLIPEHSRNRLQTWVREGLVTVDGQAASEPKIRVAAGAEIGVSLPAETSDAADQAEDIPLTVVFEDDDLLVIDKPAGLVVHPGSGNRNGTLMNALLHRIPGLAELPRAGIVHRLDKDTSGLLVVARTLAAQTDLVRQLQARTVKRQYYAVVAGSVRRDATVDAPVGRHPVHRTRMAVVPASRGGKPAVTHFRVLEQFARAAAVECSLETGRTHQIRVHMASIGHPLIGDPVYARHDPRLPEFPRQALHAMRLGLVHPSSRRPMQWESPLPDDIRALLEVLRGA
jgi:23S rRNA pseudouridine1911/1915/1917 synthase